VTFRPTGPGEYQTRRAAAEAIQAVANQGKVLAIGQPLGVLTTPKVARSASYVSGFTPGQVGESPKSVSLEWTSARFSMAYAAIWTSV